MLEHLTGARYDRLISTVVACEPFGREGNAAALSNDFADTADGQLIRRVVLFGDNLVQPEDEGEFFAIKFFIKNPNKLEVLKL